MQFRDGSGMSEAPALGAGTAVKEAERKAAWLGMTYMRLELLCNPNTCTKAVHFPHHTSSLPHTPSLKHSPVLSLILIYLSTKPSSTHITQTIVHHASRKRCTDQSPLQGQGRRLRDLRRRRRGSTQLEGRQVHSSRPSCQRLENLRHTQVRYAPVPFMITAPHPGLPHHGKNSNVSRTPLGTVPKVS